MMNRYYQILISAGIGLVLPNIAHASFSSDGQTYTYSTASGANDSVGESVSAQASFSISGDSMVVTLVNLQSGITSVGQNISSVFFDINNCGSVLSLSSQNYSSQGNEITVGSGGTITGTQSNASLDHWQISSSGNQISLNDLSGNGSPDQTVIGPANSQGDYSSVNKSIYDNAPHNPFVQNEAQFTVKFPPGQLGDNVSISNVRIGFGTAPGDNQNCYISPGRLPEPGTLPLLVIGAAAIGMIRKGRSLYGCASGISPLSHARGLTLDAAKALSFSAKFAV